LRPRAPRAELLPKGPNPRPERTDLTVAAVKWILLLVAGLCALMGAVAQLHCARIKDQGQETELDPDLKGAIWWGLCSAGKLVRYLLCRRPGNCELSLRDREAGGVTLRFLGTVLAFVALIFFSAPFKVKNGPPSLPLLPAPTTAPGAPTTPTMPAQPTKSVIPVKPTKSMKSSAPR
jgi:hypothetical protein